MQPERYPQAGLFTHLIETSGSTRGMKAKGLGNAHLANRPPASAPRSMARRAHAASPGETPPLRHPSCAAH
eukprot:4708526-Pyramimonas_sp.AAC.1